MPSQTEFIALTDLLQHIQNPSSSVPDSGCGVKLQSLLENDLLVQLPLHISLSRTLSLKTHERDFFQTALQSDLRESAVRPFQLSLTNLKWVSNYEHNRWFLMLGVARPPGDELNRLLKTCNQVCEAFNQPTLYSRADEPPPAKKRRRSKEVARGDPPDLTDSFHISLAWNIEGSSFEFEKRYESAEVKKIMETSIGSLQIHVDTVRLKIGNAVTSISLHNRVGLESTNILGK